MTGGSGGLGQMVPRGNVTMSPCPHVSSVTHVYSNVKTLRSRGEKLIFCNNCPHEWSVMSAQAQGDATLPGDNVVLWAASLLHL